MWRIWWHITVNLPVRNLSWAEEFYVRLGVEWHKRKAEQSLVLKVSDTTGGKCRVKENWILFENISWEIFGSDNWKKYIDRLAKLLYARYTGILCVEVWKRFVHPSTGNNISEYKNDCQSDCFICHKPCAWRGGGGDRLDVVCLPPYWWQTHGEWIIASKELDRYSRRADRWNLCSAAK